MNERKFLIVAISWTLITSLLLLLPLPESSTSNHWFQNFPIDKIVHCILFQGLSWFWIRYSIQKTKFNENKSALIIAILCIIFAFLSEYLQSIMGFGRQYSLLDIYADFIGIFIGFILYKSLNKKLQKIRKV